MLDRRWACAALAAALAGTCARSLSADQLVGTRFDANEKSHDIAVRLERGHAVLVVTRVVENTGSRSDQAVFLFNVPQGAVATRMRTAGVGPGGTPIWFEGELMEAEAAARKYEELTGLGGYYPKDPALLSWRSQQELCLQVFPVPARSSKTLEYTLKMPMDYSEGTYKMTLPTIGTDDLWATLRFFPARPEDVVEVNGVCVAAGAPVVAQNELEVRLAPKRPPQVDAALASFPFAKERVLVHARIAAAPRLSEPPAQSSIVVLIDSSWSMDDGFPNALEAVRAYVGQLSGAEVEILTFARKTSSPFGAMLKASDVAARLQAFSPKYENGSNLDLALAEADARLARTQAGARRILVITDLRTRDALTPEALAAQKLTSGAVVHIATVGSGVPSLVRDDDDPWAGVPRKTGGLLWHATIDTAGAPGAREVFEEWVRPKRIDRLLVTGMPESFWAPDVLDEGAALEHLEIAPGSLQSVVLEGELWSRPYKLVATPSAQEAKLWAGLVFGSPLQSELSDAEAMTLAMHGRAVSPVTSYLAIEPGVRPSTEGLERGEGIGLGAVGTFGHGSGTGSGMGFGSGGGPRLDRQAFLDSALGAALDACQATGAATIEIETTLHEIVDVRQPVLLPRDAKREACLREQMWALELPEAFTGAAVFTALARR